jgi:Peptidase family S41
MKKLLVMFLALAASTTAYSQDCNCVQSLTRLIAKVEKEYPGFGAYSRDKLAYTSFKDHWLEASKAADEDSCLDILRGYLSYFKHGHISIVQKEEDGTSTHGAAIDTVDIDAEGFREYAASTKDDLEGIWSSPSYRVGIVKKDDGYVGFIISSENGSWKPKEIKFLLEHDGKATYFMGDHSPSADEYRLVKGSILWLPENKVQFVRELPRPQLSSEEIADELNGLEGLFIRPLSKKTVLLRISSFDSAYTDRIKELLAKNAQLLKSHENLIIDVRGNPGGTDYSYQPILPYLYTNPVRHLGGQYFVTQTLIDSLTTWANDPKNAKYDDVADVKHDIQRMQGKIGQFIPYSTDGDYGFTRQDSVFASPKSVAILIDKGAASSTEKFVLDAKQSKKVKVLGAPTYGSVDYLSVLVSDFGCDRYVLYMPTVRTSRSEGYPLDNIGVQPDIYMDKYVDDWVQYAKNYLESSY